MTRLLTILAATATMVACQLDRPDPILAHENEFSKEQAKEFFINRYDGLKTRSAMLATDKDNLIVPYDYEVLWDKAEYHKSSYQETFEVPIQSERGVYARIVDEYAHTFHTPIAQKALITRNFESNRTNAYIMTIIPSQDYNNSNVYDLFHHAGDRNDFNGLILYSSLNGDLVRASKFKNGKLVFGVYMHDIELSEYQRRSNLIITLAGLSIYKHEDNTTRGDDNTHPPRYVFCEKCDDNGCDACTIYVYPEKCGECNYMTHECVCNKEEPKDTSEPEPEPEPNLDDDPEPPSTGGGDYTPNTGSSQVYSETLKYFKTRANVPDKHQKIFAAIVAHLNALSIKNFEAKINQTFDQKIEIQSYDSQYAIKQGINNATNEATTTFGYIKETGEYIATMFYHPQLTDMMTDFGIQVVMAHELYHIYYVTIHGHSEDTNDMCHADMVSNPEYIEWLSICFPNLSPDELEYIRHAGTGNEYDNAPNDAKEYIETNLYIK